MWARPGPRPARPPAALLASRSPLTPSRHTLSSLSAMAREQGARARRRPKLRRERPGPARASPGAAAARPSPGCGARLGGGRPFAGPRPGPSVASRAGPSSAAGTVRRAPGRLRCRHLGTPAGSPDLPAHLGSHLRREGGAGRRREAGGEARARGRGPRPDSPPPPAGPAPGPIPRWRVSGAGLLGRPLPSSRDRPARPGEPYPGPEPACRSPLVTSCVSLGFQKFPRYFVDLPDDLDDCK